MDDPYAAFSSPVQVTPHDKEDAYAAFSSPEKPPPQEGGPNLPRKEGESLWEYAKRSWANARAMEKQSNEPSVMERAAAIPAGFNRGVAGIVGIPVDALANAANLTLAGMGTAQSLVTGNAPSPIFTPGNPGDVPFSGEWNARQLNKLPGHPAEIPRPDDPASRYLYAAGAGASAGLIGPAAGAGVVPSTVSGASGALSSQLAAENGAGPAGQALAGIVGGAGPSALRAGTAAGTRQLARGGEQGRLNTAQNISDFERAGGQASIGQATESRATRATESMLQKTPGGAGRMVAKGEEQGQKFGANIERLAAELSPKASGEQAGRAITKGVTGEGGFIDQFKAKSSANYDALDKFVKKDQPFVLPKTVAALDQLTAKIAGAEETSKFFINSKINDIKGALSADLEAGGNTLPYEAVKKIRSIVGEQLADAPFNGDVPRSQWKKLYSALSDDISVNAKSAGPEAESALVRANQYHAAGMKRLDTISSVIDKNGGPEAVFKAATSGAKEGATTLRAVMQSLPEDAQKTLSASVLRRLGRATAGRQDELGEKFSTETFLTNWNSMSPQAKTALFDRYGKGFRSDMDAVAKVAANLREGSAVFRNPSGTSQAGAQIAAGTTFLTSLLTGHLMIAGGVAAAVGGANIAARVMTNPTAVKWLAQTTKAPKNALPALLNRAAGSDDQDLRDFAAYLKNSKQNQQQ